MGSRLNDLAVIVIKIVSGLLIWQLMPIVFFIVTFWPVMIGLMAEVGTPMGHIHELIFEFASEVITLLSLTILLYIPIGPKELRINQKRIRWGLVISLVIVANILSYNHFIKMLVDYRSYSVALDRQTSGSVSPELNLKALFPEVDSKKISVPNQSHQETVGSQLHQSQKYFNESAIKIIQPNGREILKTGSSFDVLWDAENVPSGAQLDVEVFEISGNTTDIGEDGRCLNCVGGGLRSGISAIFPIRNGAGHAVYEVGKLYSGGYLKPGSHYIMKAALSKTGTGTECPPHFATCTIDLATDWSDGAFSITK